MRLVSTVAVIETLPVQLYVLQGGGSRAPNWRNLITGLDHKLQQLVCTSHSVLSFFFFFLIKASCSFHWNPWPPSPQEAGDPLAAVLTFLTVMLSSTERQKPPPTCVVLTSGVLVHLIPVMYLALPSRSPVNRQASAGSVRTEVLTTFMNFSWDAQGGGLPSGFAGEMRLLFNGSYRRCPPTDPWTGWTSVLKGFWTV